MLDFLLLSCVSSMLVFFQHLLKQLAFLWFPWASPCWKLTLCWLNFAYYPESKKGFCQVSHNPSWGTEWLSLAEGKLAHPVAFWTTQKSTQFNPPHPVYGKSGKWRYTHTGFLSWVGRQCFFEIISIFIQFLTAVCHTEFYTVKLFFPGSEKLFI